MTDLSTTYLGLQLKNPLVASASPLTKKIVRAKKMADAGIGAIVMYSLFEEQIIHESLELDHYLSRGADAFPEALSYLPDGGLYSVRPEKYLNQVAGLKKAVDVPVIGSLNGVSKGGWTSYARDGSDGGKALTEWLSHHYHLPSDDLAQPIPWQAAARLAYVNYRIGLGIGNDRKRPAWKPGDFFGKKFGRR